MASIIVQLNTIKNDPDGQDVLNAIASGAEVINDDEFDISTELNIIRNPANRYGIDIRMAIHDALEKLSKKVPDPSKDGGFICTSDAAFNGICAISPIATLDYQYEFPADCPFTCDPNYFINSQQQCTIAGRTFTKLNTDYAIGMIVVVDVEGVGVCTGVLYLSPVSQNSILYSPYHTYWGQYGDEREITYHGVTWYASGIAGGMGGDQRNNSSGMVIYPGTGSVYYPASGWTEEILCSILEDVGAENKEVQ